MPKISLPGLECLRSYRPQWLKGDILAGITVAAYLVPQCMAYGELAGVQPVAGLWAILPPMLIYTIWGSSPQLSLGPESTTAVMTAVSVAPLVRAGEDYATVVSLMAIAVGIVCLVGYLARLGVRRYRQYRECISNLLFGAGDSHNAVTVYSETSVC
jgi:MFS superfamily sulfate permease-like transporter